MNAGSLFSGYGGLDLAVEAVLGAQTAWQCEVEPAPSRVLAARWPGVPNLGDITRVDFALVEPVDVICGGFPCQPFSQAGKRQGESDERHLWPFFVEAIRAIRPRLVILENVSGLLSIGGNYADPGDRCLCGWPAGRGGMYRRVGRISDGRDTGGRRHDHEGERCPVPDAEDLRGEGWIIPGSHRQVGGGTSLADVRAGGSRVPEGSRTSCGAEVRADQVGSTDRADPGRSAQDTDRTFSLGYGDLPAVPDPLCADQRVEPEGACSTPGRVGSSLCPACGRPVGHNAADLLFRSGMGTVLGDLAGAGYDVRWCCVRAADVGAPHGRRRLFVVAAYAERGGWDGWPGEQRSGWWAEPADRREPATDTDVDGRWGWAEADTAGWQDGSGPRPDPARRGTDAPTDATRDQGWISDGNDGAAWGQYEPAIHRWERILGRAAPAPTELAPRGGQRLSPRFVEWLMGLPDGWVTDVPGVSRNEQLRMLGNGVVPQQAQVALAHLLNADAWPRAAACRPPASPSRSFPQPAPKPASLPRGRRGRGCSVAVSASDHPHSKIRGGQRDRGEPAVLRPQVDAEDPTLMGERLRECEGERERERPGRPGVADGADGQDHVPSAEAADRDGLNLGPVEAGALGLGGVDSAGAFLLDRRHTPTVPTGVPTGQGAAA